MASIVRQAPRSAHKQHAEPSADDGGQQRARYRRHAVAAGNPLRDLPAAAVSGPRPLSRLVQRARPGAPPPRRHLRQRLALPRGVAAGRRGARLHGRLRRRRHRPRPPRAGVRSAADGPLRARGRRHGACRHRPPALRPRLRQARGVCLGGERTPPFTETVQTTLRHYGDDDDDAAAAAAEQFLAWFIQQPVEQVAAGPGWLRSRLFVAGATFLTLHDYEREPVLGGDTDTPRRANVLAELVAAEHRQTWALFYVGPAPRDLEALASSPSSVAFTAPDPAISSYVTRDSLAIPYRLEGNLSPDAATVALSNSLLTSLHMWDPLVAVLKAQRPDLRILRYDSRGRHAAPQPPVAATLDKLASDLEQLLGALRISRLHALIGVSIGGATALRFALRWSSRLGRFIACDFNAASSAANTQAWKERVALAERDSGRGIQELARQTVARWLHPASGAKAGLVPWMTAMAAANHVEGFKYTCMALWDYDLRPDMGRCSVPGLLVAGKADAKGVLASTMGDFRHMVGRHGADLKLVPNAGHLPMCEDPEAFWACIRDCVKDPA